MDTISKTTNNKTSSIEFIVFYLLIIFVGIVVPIVGGVVSLEIIFLLLKSDGD
ncbi:MAG: hypothetical protein P8X73_16135 [Ignavibacteriaceae bacterium]